MIGTLKHVALQMVAAAICRLPALASLRRSLLLDWRFAGNIPRGRIRNALFHHVLGYWFEHVYRVEPDPDRRENMKQEIMEHRSLEWIPAYVEQPVGSVKHRLLTTLDGSLVSTSGALVIEIGAGPGKDIAWLAVRHPHHTFIGTEPFSAGVAYARAHYQAPNLRYEVAGALEASRLLLEGPSVRRYVFALGVLNYLQPEHLQRLLGTLASIPQLDLLACEPYHGDADRPGSRFRANFSWTHGYRHYGEAAGLTTRALEIQEQVFYWGTTVP